MIAEEIIEIKKVTNEIEGYLSLIEGKLLYNLAKNCKNDGVIVEIGSWKGKSTICLGKGSIFGNKIKIYAIDPHTGSSEHQVNNQKIWTYPIFEKNIKNNGLENIVIPVIKKSEDAFIDFKAPIGLIFIDGAHEYKYVKKDFELWYQKLNYGGIIALHDTTNFSGPKKVAEEKLFKSKYFKNVKCIGSITFAEKVIKNNLKDRIKNRLFLLKKNLNNFILKLLRFIRTLSKFIFKKVLIFVIP